MQYFNPALLRKQAADAPAQPSSIENDQFGMFDRLSNDYGMTNDIDDVSNWWGGQGDKATAAGNRALTYFAPKLVGALGFAAVASLLAGRKGGALVPLLGAIGGFLLGGPMLKFFQDPFGPTPGAVKNDTDKASTEKSENNNAPENGAKSQEEAVKEQVGDVPGASQETPQQNQQNQPTAPPPTADPNNPPVVNAPNEQQQQQQQPQQQPQQLGTAGEPTVVTSDQVGGSPQSSNLMYSPFMSPYEMLQHSMNESAIRNMPTNEVIEERRVEGGVPFNHVPGLLAGKPYNGGKPAIDMNTREGQAAAAYYFNQPRNDIDLNKLYSDDAVAAYLNSPDSNTDHLQSFGNKVIYGNNRMHVLSSPTEARKEMYAQDVKRYAQRVPQYQQRKAKPGELTPNRKDALSGYRWQTLVNRYVPRNNANSSK